MIGDPTGPETGWRHSAVKFAMVGGINTLLCVAVIFSLKLFGGVGDVTANISGYVVGLGCSFVLNRRWTFAHSGDWLHAGLRFLGVFAVAYLLNLMVVMGLIVVGLDSYLAHLAGMPLYTIVFYFGCRFFVFAPPSVTAPRSAAAMALFEKRLHWAFGAALLLRFLYPRFNSPMGHLYSDPARHWDNGLRLLNPTFMGSSDPILYQLWLFLLTRGSGDIHPLIQTATGFLCVMMPYGWYRALKELLPRRWALGGALVIALVPGFLGIYAYFMNETLLMSLTGFAFWATFRAQRKRTFGAFVIACTLWLAAGFTRSIALPIALLCLLAVWVPQRQRIIKGAAGAVILLVFLIPAGLHARVNLNFFAPFGNPYLNPIYAASGNKNIDIDLGSKGRYGFGSPSFYNPTFYPFSGWTTDRTGTVSIAVNLAEGRASWLREKYRVEHSRTFPRWRLYWESLVYTLFGQSWPDDDLGSVTGSLTVWTRWLWPPLMLIVAIGAARRQFLGKEWLLPCSALALVAYCVVQNEGVMEGRYRKPLDPIFVAAAVVLAHRARARPSEWDHIEGLCGAP